MQLQVDFLGARFLGVDDFARAGFKGYSINRGGLTGWWGRPSGSGGAGRRGNAHGEHDAPLQLGARFVTIEGQVREHSSRERGIASRRLAGLGADGARARVLVTDEGFTAWAWCRVVSAEVDRYTSGHHPEYELVLKCANPRIFGETRPQPAPTSGFVTLENRGNFPAPPRFLVLGPQPSGYSIVAPGHPNYQVDSVLAAGKSDLLDFATGTILRDGVPLLGSAAKRRVWTVPAEGEQAWQAATTGSGKVTAEITDTYV